MRQLKQQSITAADPVYKPLHYYLKQKGCSVSARLTQEALSIPIYLSLKDRDINRIVKCLT